MAGDRHYTIVSVTEGYTTDLVVSLRQAVQQSINDGWTPLGGVCVVNQAGSLFGFQAMTRDRVPSEMEQNLRASQQFADAMRGGQ